MKYMLIIGIIVFFSSCKFNHERIEYFNQEDKSIIVKKYSNDTIQEEVRYLKDTLTKEGLSKYYINGIVSKIIYWDNNKMAGSYTEFKDGKPIVFVCHDSYGSIILLRRYSGNRITFDTGYLFPHGAITAKNFKTDSTITYTSFVVHPPFTKIWIENSLIKINTNDTLKPIETAVDYDWAHYYTFKVTDPNAIYRYNQVTFIVDSLRNNTSIIRVVSTATFDPPKK